MINMALHTSLLSAQDDELTNVRDRLFFGGNFGLQFGTITNIEISPLIGYYITSRLASGIGIKYEYYKDSRDYSYLNYETNIYGGSLFSRYLIIKNMSETIKLGINSSIFTHAEYEMLSLERKYFEFPPTLEDGRFIVHSILVGGGLLQPIGRRSAFLMMVLWNLNESAQSPYHNPVIRIGFNF